MADVQKKVREESLILVNDERFDAFCEQLDKPKKPNPRLKKLLDQK